jgi:hypothetical protein
LPCTIVSATPGIAGFLNLRHGKRRPKAALSPGSTVHRDKFSVPSAPAPQNSEGRNLIFSSTNILIDLSLRRQQKSLRKFAAQRRKEGRWQQPLSMTQQRSVRSGPRHRLRKTKTPTSFAKIAVEAGSGGTSMGRLLSTDGKLTISSPSLGVVQTR